jgi:Sec-independent protein translocase protein TatA
MQPIALFLNDVAGSEIVLIVLVVLMFFGSKSIPGIAKTLGQALYQIRNASNDLQQEIRRSGQEMKADLNIKDILKETEESLTGPIEQITTDINHTVHYGSMPKQVKQQVTAGNPVEEVSDNAPDQNQSNPTS